MDLQTEVRSLRAILDDLREGRIRIPRLQRPYVWTNSQVLTLLDSVRNQYPIGSLMLWNVDRDIGFKREIGPVAIPAQTWRDGQTVDYLLDGQQRLTTLLGALFAPEVKDPASRRWQIHFDARTEIFAHSRKALAAHEIPMRVVLDSFALLKHLDKVRSGLGEDQAAVRRLVEQTQGMAARPGAGRGGRCSGWTARLPAAPAGA